MLIRGVLIFLCNSLQGFQSHKLHNGILLLPVQQEAPLFSYLAEHEHIQTVVGNMQSVTVGELHESVHKTSVSSRMP